MILRWLLPLGLLGALGIVVLLILYLLKPQYREQRVSGTLVWKRVMLRKKRQIPVLSHILLFLLQALFLVLMALALAEPHLFSKDVLLEDTEYVIILDASASMRARTAEEGGRTRFQRAVDGAKELSGDLFEDSEGGVSVILADNDPDYIALGLGRSRRSELFSALDGAACTDGAADIEEALELARAQLDTNPYAKIFLYTDTAFGNLGSAVTVIDLADARTEWNAAILGCDVAMRDNEYEFTIRVGAYGDVALRQDLKMTIWGAKNDKNVQDIELTVPVVLEVDPDSETKEAVFEVTVRATDEEFGGAEGYLFDAFDEVELRLPDLADSIEDDDVFHVYGGERDRVRVEYWSGDPNFFWYLGFSVLRNDTTSRRSFDFKEAYNDGDKPVATEGYDMYVFEHAIPAEVLEGGLPQDGIVILSDPDASVAETGLGIETGELVDLGELTGCTTAVEHPLLAYCDPANIRLTQYRKLDVRDPFFLPLLYCNGDPVLYVKNTPDTKIVVLPFSINMSDFYGREFFIFLYDLVEYFLPVTLEAYDYTPGERAPLRCKGVSLEVEGGGETRTFEEFPAEYPFPAAGTYTFTTHFGLKREDEVRKVYVHIAAEESALFCVSDLRATLDNRELTGEAGKDLFLWFAAAAVVLLVVEWYLQFKDIV